MFPKKLHKNIGFSTLNALIGTMFAERERERLTAYLQNKFSTLHQAWLIFLLYPPIIPLSIHLQKL